MAGFDTVALVTSIFDPDNKLVQLNKTLHESKIYNGVQLTLGALGAFGSGMIKGIKYDIQNGISKCFIAGTLISTASGFVAIENIKAGDKVLSTNEITKETETKTVVETYVRETMKLIHIRVSGEEITTTHSHPFYVKDNGFIEAGELTAGEKLVDASGNVLLIEDICERHYHIDRMLNNLRMSGVLDRLSGVIVGQFTDCDDDLKMGCTLQETIRKIFADYDYPVIFNAPYGHVDNNMPIFLSLSSKQ
jgi:muramoyltetrapeptide carboxypeptidase LdcA involved in peptidoglycan recycling